MRLDKYLSDMNVGSRSEVRKMIRDKRIRVENVSSLRPETQVNEDSLIYVDDTLLVYRPYEYILLNKPEGVYSTLDKSPSVLDLVEADRKDLFPVGRLDRMTQGLILLTNDGELAHRLISPRYEVEKLYYVETQQNIPARAAKVFEEGIRFQEFVSAPAAYEPLSENSGNLIIREGKYHQVRRMFGHLGCDVTKLVRRRFAFLTDSDLACGDWRHLSQKEILQLKELVHM